MSKPRAARVAQFKDFLKPENKQLFERLLSPRKEKVAKLVAEGKSYDEIAEHFTMSVERITQIANKVAQIIRRHKRNA